MSGPPNVGTGELSRIARKKSPNAPKWRNIEAKLRPRAGVAVWKRTFNMGNLTTILDCFRNRHCATRSDAFNLIWYFEPLLRQLFLTSAKGCLDSGRGVALATASFRRWLRSRATGCILPGARSA